MQEGTLSKRKWYLDTWFIVLLFAAWPLFLPPILGIVFLVLHYQYQAKLNQRYGALDSLDDLIANKSKEFDEQCKKHEYEFDEQRKKHEQELEEFVELSSIEKAVLEKESEQFKALKAIEKLKLKGEIEEIKEELKVLASETLVENYNLSDYDNLTSEQCQNKLSMLKTKEQQMIQEDKAVLVTSSDNKRVINNNVKQALRCFNSECDNVLLNISVKNIDTSRSKIQKSFESLNKIFSTNGVSLSTKLLESKLEGLNLVYTYELKREQEREQQKAIKEQMLEEEKVRREIEREKAKIEKDQSQVSGEIGRLMKYLQKTQNDSEKELYLDKIRELEDRLKQLEEDKSTVLEREANARAGFVYIISNIGSFGDDVYKIGMTRRLEPMDRIKELSSASVPFDFDVHAMIFSNDAPELENSLHKHFGKQSINMVNPRKEFFRVKLDEIEKHVKDNFNNTTEFTHIALAPQYRQSLELGLAQ